MGAWPRNLSDSDGYAAWSMIIPKSCRLFGQDHAPESM